jgi:hypothetical protein
MTASLHRLQTVIARGGHLRARESQSPTNSQSRFGVRSPTETALAFVAEAHLLALSLNLIAATVTGPAMPSLLSPADA